MASFVGSNWKITFDYGGANAYQLLDYGDEIDDEIAFPWSQTVDTSKPLRVAAAVKFGRGAMETGFTVGVWKTHANQLTARNWLLAHAAGLPLGMAKTLRIDVYGGASYSLSTAVIVSGDGRMVPGTGPVRTWVKYVIEGGKFSLLP